MKIIEKDSGIQTTGAKFHTADRPDNLSAFLNYVNLTLIIGLPASGKSSLIKTLLNGTHEDNLYNNVFNSVYYISPSDTMDLNLPDDKMINLDKEPLENILQNIIDVEEGLGEQDDPHRVLIILDDAINYINTNRKALSIFRKLVMNGRHILGRHSSVALWIVSQKVKSIPLTIRSQANQVTNLPPLIEKKQWNYIIMFMMHHIIFYLLIYKYQNLKECLKILINLF